MTSTARPDPSSSSSPRPIWGWVALGVALGWIALVRVPLVLNAGSHLDSDLAVDGLTLVDALAGRWRWHYPATPFIGTPPVLLSYLQARFWGPNPMTLVSGGVVAYGLLVVATYVLNRRAFGVSVAIWGLVPLAFASTGVVWLSGRVTGGHLLAAVWHAGAFALLWEALTRGGWRRWAGLGLWAGFGLYVDSMVAVTWAGLGVAVFLFGMMEWGRRSRGLAGSVSGVTSPHPNPPPQGGREPEGSPPPGATSPHPNPPPQGGREPEGSPSRGATSPHPNPPPQGGREPEGSRHSLQGRGSNQSPPPLWGRVGWGGISHHPAPRTKGKSFVRSLACLLAFALASGVGLAPRVIGARVDPHDAYVGQFEPDTRVDHLAGNARILLLDCLPRLVAGHRLPGLQAEPDPGPSSTMKSVPWFGLAVAVASIGLFGRSMVAVATGNRQDPARSAIRWGLLASSLVILVGFLVYPSISNSDHYRYLVCLLVPWSTGFGLGMGRWAAKGRGAAWSAGALALGFALLMTTDTGRWYARLGYIDPAGRPIRKRVEEPVVDWLDDRLKYSTIVGDYWDVYRVSFLTQGRVKAVPFPQYPDRFPALRLGLAGSSNPVVIVRPGPLGALYGGQARASGGRELFRSRGLSIVQWPKGMPP